MPKYIVFVTGKIGSHIGNVMSSLDWLVMQGALSELHHTPISKKDNY